MNGLDTLLARDHFGVKLGLETIGRLVAELGHPERTRQTIIVAGTNGKGSVAAMVACGLRAAGHHTGLYTSPHLVDVEERFVIDGVRASRQAVNAALERVLDAERRAMAAGRLGSAVTYFELTTAAAFELFREASVDVVVLEVGLGGRFDATNIAPAAAGAITTIDLEHTQHLGTTLAQIAYEKAGIIKPGMAVATGEGKPEAVEVIARVAREQGAELIEAHRDVRRHVELRDGVTELTLETPKRNYGTITLALRGRHQADNAVVAARLLEAIDEHVLAVPAEAVVAGLSRAEWPGRLQTVPWGGRTLLVDGAHNPAGAQRLADYLAEVHPGGVPFVVGVMRDKAIADMLRAVAGVATRFVFTEPRNPRACPARELAMLAEQAGLDRRIDVDESVPSAIDRALAGAPLAVVAGSLYLIGEVLAHAGIAPLTVARSDAVAARGSTW